MGTRVQWYTPHVKLWEPTRASLNADTVAQPFSSSRANSSGNIRRSKVIFRRSPRPISPPHVAEPL